METGSWDENRSATSFPPYVETLPTGDRSTTERGVEDFLSKLLEFEEWRINGSPEDGLEYDDLSPEQKQMAQWGPEAFDYFRHSIWAYLEPLLHLNPWTSMLRSLLVRALQADPVGFDSFLEEVDKGADRFAIQKRNANQAQRELSKDAPPRQRFRAMLKTFAEYYEIDFPLWFLAVVGDATKTGNIRPGVAGGSNTCTPQGSLITLVKEKLKATPLERFFRQAFDPKLRNIVLHNSYRLDVGQDSVSVSSLIDDRVWTGDELYASYMGTIQFVEAVWGAVAYIKFVDGTRRQGVLRDSGIVTVTFSIDEVGTPLVTIFQMWCFHQIDPGGHWLDAATFEIEQPNDEEEIARLTANCFTRGTRISDTPFGELVKEYGWVHVKRIPVAPDFDLGFPSLETPAGSYEIVGPPSEHFVPYLQGP